MTLKAYRLEESKLHNHRKYLSNWHTFTDENQNKMYSKKQKLFISKKGTTPTPFT